MKQLPNEPPIWLNILFWILAALIVVWLGFSIFTGCVTVIKAEGDINIDKDNRVIGVDSEVIVEKDSINGE